MPMVQNCSRGLYRQIPAHVVIRGDHRTSQLYPRYSSIIEYVTAVMDIRYFDPFRRIQNIE